MSLTTPKVSAGPPKTSAVRQPATNDAARPERMKSRRLTPDGTCFRNVAFFMRASIPFHARPRKTRFAVDGGAAT